MCVYMGVHACVCLRVWGVNLTVFIFCVDRLQSSVYVGLWCCTYCVVWCCSCRVFVGVKCFVLLIGDSDWLSALEQH